MSTYAGLPVAFLRFWFFEAPREILAFYGSLNSSFLRFFSLPLYLRTFFKPLKNEYRKGLVRFSVITGMLLKTILILFDLLLFGILLILEGVLLLTFIGFPLLTIAIFIL